MKLSEVIVIFSLITIVIFGGITCVKSIIKTDNREIEAAYFEKGNKTLAAEVDVTGGWSVLDDRSGTAYISNNKTEKGQEITALAAPICEKTYYTCVNNSNVANSHRKEIYGGILYTNPTGEVTFVKKLGKNDYFQVKAHHITQAQLQDVVSRISFKYI
jgi:hypothetical protein